MRAHFNTHKSVYILCQMKAEIVLFVSRVYKNMSFYEKFAIMVLNQVRHIAVYFRCAICKS